MLADSAPVLIWATDAVGACQFVNQSYLTYTGDTLEGARAGLAAGYPSRGRRGLPPRLANGATRGSISPLLYPQLLAIKEITSRHTVGFYTAIN
jgi:hypothetical protein